MIDRAEPAARGRTAFIAAVWACALAAALLVDAPLAAWIRHSGVEQAIRQPGPLHAAAAKIKLGGTYLTVLAAAAVIGAIHRLRWRAGVLVALSGAAALVNSLLKWVVGRTRPFRLPEDIAQPAPFILAPFRGGLAGLLRDTNLSFPSGHAAVAFAAATALAALWPRARAFFYALAALVAVERVAENAHYASDVVAAAALAVAATRIIVRVWRQSACTQHGQP